MCQSEKVLERAHGSLESRLENLVEFLGEKEIMGVDEAD